MSKSEIALELLRCLRKECTSPKLTIITPLLDKLLRNCTIPFSNRSMSQSRSRFHKLCYGCHHFGAYVFIL